MKSFECTWSEVAPIDLLTEGLIARGWFADDVFVDSREAERARVLGFESKPGQVHSVLGERGVEFLVGLGSRDRLDLAAIRKSVAALVRAASRVPTVVTTLVGDVGESLPSEQVAVAIARTAMSTRYRFEKFVSKPSSTGPDRLHIVAPPSSFYALERAVVSTQGVLLARDLVNEPGGSLVPSELARRCEALTSSGIRVVVHDHNSVEALGMGGLLGVNRGSDQPSRFVELHWDPVDAPASRLVLVGKGVTFDTGGIHLKKTATALNGMKTDMGGAAAIIGAMKVVAELGIGTRVSAYLPMTDNMTGGDATRPGDVLRMFDGTTVEVVDTDAEGRLILGDAVAFAAATSPSAIVDVATLTGTAIHVTGMHTAPFVSTSDWLADQIATASASTTDRVWRMPRVPEYRGLLASSVADVCNRSEAPASSAFAALFIESFAKEIPFAHIDMAAVVASDRELDDRPAGATGWGVDLLVELVRRFAPPGPVTG